MVLGREAKSIWKNFHPGGEPNWPHPLRCGPFAVPMYSFTARRLAAADTSVSEMSGVSDRCLLITGCNGFIGRSLAEACLSEGWQVRGGIRSAQRAVCLPGKVQPAAVGDIGPGTDWSEALRGVDAVVHLAAKVHEAGGKGSEAEYYGMNTAGTARLARSAAEAGVKRLVFISTLKVHGEQSSSAFRENDPPDPRGAYAISKNEAENVLREISARTGLEAVILRPPLVYGPGVKANFLKLLGMIARGVPLPFKTIENRRSLVYLGNLVNGVLACLAHPAAAGKTYLIADEEPVSTPELIRETAYALGVTPKLFRSPAVFLDMAAFLFGKSELLHRLTGSLWADTGTIRMELGWRPKFTLAEGLRETASWYREFQSPQAGY
jgi:nucleoside-diphosphate-sugar epimerase